MTSTGRAVREPIRLDAVARSERGETNREVVSVGDAEAGFVASPFRSLPADTDDVADH